LARKVSPLWKLLPSKKTPLLLTFTHLRSSGHHRTLSVPLAASTSHRKASSTRSSEGRGRLGLIGHLIAKKKERLLMKAGLAFEVKPELLNQPIGQIEFYGWPHIHPARNDQNVFLQGALE
jgi:hypothetical protein